METSYKFKFSIVMAVYNVEQFLREAIDSVISQDIGFNEHVQLILVDDGSSDSSGAICDQYGKLYPENIEVIHKENGGVSTARNEGLQYIKGKYVNFLDSDDKLEGSTLRLVGEFFDENYTLTDVVSLPIEFFDGQTGSHLLNYKFDKGTRVVDLSIVYNYIQLSLSSAFIKYEDAKDINFDANLKYAEDAKVCLEILGKKQTLGVLAEGKYYYRKRLTGESSAIQKSGTNADWYTPYLENFTYSLINYYVNKKQPIPWFIQYALMYDLQWRFKTDYTQIVNVLGIKASDEFLNKLLGTLDYIDDEIILAQRNLYPEHKSFLLKKKYGEDLKLAIDRSGEYALYLNQQLIIKLGRCQTKLEFLSFDSDSVCVELLNTYIGDTNDIPYE
ncbi:glycosyltransferase family 2 protein [Veillonella intestinalis]|uniref:glycosyltransferase family 2 protein n=1 Tax=Veillonella intestinalis TaxID=2941341 RepID=UPI00203B689D|nr:glycosyltransferase [Veillonella intestinalis]